MKVMKFVILIAIILAVLCSIIGYVSQKETDVYLASVDAFIQEVE